MSILTDIKARSIEDILITYTDNLNGFNETIWNSKIRKHTKAKL